MGWTCSLSKKELERRLDRLTSTLTRNREGRCATCGKRLLKKQRQAGHFLPRYIKYTRWYPRNVHTQCARCNVELDGNIPEYRKYIEKRYGKDTLAYLDYIRAVYNTGRLPSPTEEALKEWYNSQLVAVRRLEKSPGELIPRDWAKV